jgi:lipid II:glycine glycyltransferase (peptidoglycan interpeptide bridge formation enzyme)
LAYQKVRASKRNQQLSCIEISDNDGPHLLALTRIIKIPLLGLRIGYIHWGPLLRKNHLSVNIKLEALKLLREYYLPRHLDILRITPNIYTIEADKNYDETVTSAGFEKVKRITPYHTMLFPLDIDEDQMRLKFHKKWRAALRKSEKNGMTVYDTKDVQALIAFDKIYQRSQERKKFRGLNVQEFIQTQNKLLDTQKINITVVKKDNEFLSIDINSYLGDTSLGLFQATSEHGLSLGASYLAWWAAFLAAKRAGMRRYDMGGIDPVGNPNVYQFKLRIGGDEATHIGCYDAYASKRAKHLFSIVEYLYRLIKGKK